MQIKNTISWVITALLLSMLAVVPAYAKMGSGMNFGKIHMAPGIIGTVSAVNGNTLTVTAKNNNGTMYTVNAANATVTKNGATSTILNVGVGDIVMIKGTVNGTTVTATMIVDGLPALKLPPIQGNGQPVVMGNVTAINGTTLTITNKSNVTYTINALSAKVVKQGKDATLSEVVVGDSIVVQGTVNGTSVVASSIIDQQKSSSAVNELPQNHHGFMNGMGNFFRQLFGF